VVCVCYVMCVCYACGSVYSVYSYYCACVCCCAVWMDAVWISMCVLYVCMWVSMCVYVRMLYVCLCATAHAVSRCVCVCVRCPISRGLSCPWLPWCVLLHAIMLSYWLVCMCGCVWECVMVACAVRVGVLFVCIQLILTIAV